MTTLPTRCHDIVLLMPFLPVLKRPARSRTTWACNAVHPTGLSLPRLVQVAVRLLAPSSFSVGSACAIEEETGLAGRNRAPPNHPLHMRHMTRALAIRPGTVVPPHHHQPSFLPLNINVNVQNVPAYGLFSSCVLGEGRIRATRLSSSAWTRRMCPCSFPVSSSRLIQNNQNHQAGSGLPPGTRRLESKNTVTWSPRLVTHRHCYHVEPPLV